MATDDDCLSRSCLKSNPLADADGPLRVLGRTLTRDGSTHASTGLTAIIWTALIFLSPIFLSQYRALRALLATFPQMESRLSVSGDD